MGICHLMKYSILVLNNPLIILFDIFRDSHHSYVKVHNPSITPSGLTSSYGKCDIKGLHRQMPTN